MMAALEDEITAALKQVGAGAAGTDIPALLESIMGAMAAGAGPGPREPDRCLHWGCVTSPLRRLRH